MIKQQHISILFGVLTIVLLAMFAFPGSADAATYTWDGEGGDTNWSTCDNWSSNTCPLTTDSVIFSASSTKDVSIDADLTVSSFTINSGYTGTIAPASNQTITMTGSFSQAAGIFTASNATTTLRGSFTSTGGTFNHNSGLFVFAPNGGSSATYTFGSVSFNNVDFYRGATGGSTSNFRFASDMAIEGDLTISSVETNGNSMTIWSNIPGSPRTITVGGNISFPSTSASGPVSFGYSGGDTYRIITQVGGSLTMADSNVTIYSDFVFTGTGTHTLTKSAGTVRDSSDWSQTGTGLFALGANFSGSQTLNIASSSDFTFSSSAYTFTSADATISDGISFTPTGPSSYIFSDLNLPTGTFNATASTSITDLTISGGTFNAVSNASTTLTGNLTYSSGTFNHNSGIFLIKPPGASTRVISAGGIEFNDVTIWRTATGGSSSGVYLGSDMSIAGNLTILSDETNGYELVVRSNLSGTPRTITVGGNLYFPSTSASSQVYLGYGSTYSVSINLGGNLTMSDSSTLLYSDINFTGTGTNTITRTVGTINTQSDWTINKSAGQAVLGASLVSNGTLNIATGTMSLAGFNINVSGTTTVGSSGNLYLQGGETITVTPVLSSGSTVTYIGTSGPYTLKNYSYKNLTINGSGATFNLPATLTVAGNLTITAGTLDSTATPYSLSVSGNWSNTDTFTPRTGTVTLNGTNQAINGTTTFYNLTKSVSTADTLTFASSSTQTISNTLTLGGASGNLLSLRSNDTGFRWKIDPQGTRTLTYLDVKDSQNINATIISTDNTMDNSGNNINWDFDTTEPVLSDGLPSGSQTANTTSVTLSLTTDEEATCKYGTVADTAYSSIADTFTSTASTSHSTSITGLTNGTSYTYYIRCIDAEDNENTSDYEIVFSIASPAVTETPASAGPTAKYAGYSYLESPDYLKWLRNLMDSNNNIPPPKDQVTPVKNANVPEGFVLVKNLQAGNRLREVQVLQKTLNALGFKVSTTGAGSPGKETDFFGPATKQAVIRFQKYYKIKPAVGFFGPITRAKINELNASNALNN